MRIPKDERGLIKFAKEQIEICSASMGNRASAYAQYAQYIETGRSNGGLSLANTLYSHVDRLSSHLFCPTDTRFNIDFEHVYEENVLLQAEQAARNLTRAFGNKNFDLSFSNAVWQSLSFGSSIIKLSGKIENITIGDKTMSHIKEANARIVPPWLFGVENEGRNGLSDQEAMLEKVYLNKHDVWRRIAHFEGAEGIYKKIMAYANKGPAGPTLPASYIQVLSTNQISLASGAGSPPSPGGIAQLAGNPSNAQTPPQVLTEQVEMNELWVWDDERSDYLMIQMIAPDVLIAPKFKRTNDFCPTCIPYNLVQPNEVPGYFWGRSEITDLITLQEALSSTMDDFQRLIGVQYDKRVAFEGYDGDPQELYDDFRNNGWVSGRAGSKVTDMTPQLPAGALEYIKLLRTTMDDVSGFGNILSGQGEAGVRAGSHANALMKTASPRLRDRSLIIERNYAAFGDNYLHYMQAKDATQYYTNPDDKEKTAFILEQLPDDRRVVVDSHSSSPIYENDHNQLVSFGLKSGLVGGDDAIKMLNFPNGDELVRKFIAKQKAASEAQQKLLKEHPELAAKLLSGGKK